METQAFLNEVRLGCLLTGVWAILILIASMKTVYQLLSGLFTTVHYL